MIYTLRGLKNKLTIDEYQKKALTTALDHPDTLMDKTIWAMGVAGEAGELVDKWKKVVAYKNGKVTQEDLEGLKKELGDVMWYIAVFANSLNLSLNEVAKLNLQKLADRNKRNVIKGKGDNR